MPKFLNACLVLLAIGLAMLLCTCATNPQPTPQVSHVETGPRVISAGEDEAVEPEEDEEYLEFEIEITFRGEPYAKQAEALKGAKLRLDVETKYRTETDYYSLDDAKVEGKTFTWSAKEGYKVPERGMELITLEFDNSAFGDTSYAAILDQERLQEVTLDFFRRAGDSFFASTKLDVIDYLARDFDNYEYLRFNQPEEDWEPHYIFIDGRVRHSSGQPIGGALDSLALLATDPETNDYVGGLEFTPARNDSFKIIVPARVPVDDPWQNKGAKFVADPFGVYDEQGEYVFKSSGDGGHQFSVTAQPLQSIIYNGAISWDPSAFYPPYGEHFGIKLGPTDDPDAFTLSDILIDAPLIELRVFFDLGEKYMWEEDYDEAIERGEDPTRIPLREPIITRGVNDWGRIEVDEPDLAILNAAGEKISMDRHGAPLIGNAHEGFTKHMLLSAEDWEFTYYISVDNAINGESVRFSAPNERLTFEKGEFRHVSCTLRAMPEKEEEEEAGPLEFKIELKSIYPRDVRPLLTIHYGFERDGKVDWAATPFFPIHIEPNSESRARYFSIDHPKDCERVHAYLAFIDEAEAKRFGESELKIGETRIIEAPFDDYLILGDDVELGAAQPVAPVDAKVDEALLTRRAHNLTLDFGVYAWAVSSIEVLTIKQGEEFIPDYQAGSQSASLYLPAGSVRIEIRLAGLYGEKYEKRFYDLLEIPAKGSVAWRMPDHIAGVEREFNWGSTHDVSYSRSIDGPRIDRNYEPFYLPVGEWFAHIRDGFGISIPHRITLRAGELKQIKLAGPKRSDYIGELLVDLPDPSLAETLRSFSVDFEPIDIRVPSYGSRGIETGYRHGKLFVDGLPTGVPLRLRLSFYHLWGDGEGANYVIPNLTVSAKGVTKVRADQLHKLYIDERDSEERRLVDRLYGDRHHCYRWDHFSETYFDAEGKETDSLSLVEGERYILKLDARELPEDVALPPLEIEFIPKNGFTFSAEQLAAAAEWFAKRARLGSR